ncbi:MAG: phosphotransferase [Steroidobacteraceae bacterium]
MNETSIPNLIEQIKQRYEWDQTHRPRAVIASDVPISYESITSEWLTAVLCGKHPPAAVVDFRLDEPDNGSSNRRRIFLQYNQAGQEAVLPSSVFCKASNDLSNRLQLGLSGAARAEVTFFNSVRPLVDFHAPRAYFANYDPRSYASIVMLEDIAGKVEFCTHTTPMTRQRAESQIRLLAKLHSRFHENADLRTIVATLGTWPEYFGRCVAAFRLEEYCNVGFLRGESVIPARLYKRSAEVWPATLASVAAHPRLPQTLMHGDVHLRNWYIASDGEMGLGDWQMICSANWSRDVAYAIATALTVDDRRAWEKDLIALYLDEVAQAGLPTPSREVALTLYRQQLFAALAWWTITLTPSPEMPDMQPAASSLEFIKRITHAIDDLDALESFQ